jgi:hypothetical protein
MKIGAIYSFKNGREIVESKYSAELKEIQQVIAAIDSELHKTKRSEEKTMPGKILYNPVALNAAFKQEFHQLGWEPHREPCVYPTEYYLPGEAAIQTSPNAFREMDFVKNRVGIEVQFGKYAFMVYNVAAKMTIFHNLGVIDVGVEIVPLKRLANEMSTGVSYFEQFAWDLDHRGTANIDIPVLILGLTP